MNTFVCCDKPMILNESLNLYICQNSKCLMTKLNTEINYPIVEYDYFRNAYTRHERSQFETCGPKNIPIKYRFESKQWLRDNVDYVFIPRTSTKEIMKLISKEYDLSIIDTETVLQNMRKYIKLLKTREEFNEVCSYLTS